MNKKQALWNSFVFAGVSYSSGLPGWPVSLRTVWYHTEARFPSLVYVVSSETTCKRYFFSFGWNIRGICVRHCVCMLLLDSRVIIKLAKWKSLLMCVHVSVPFCSYGLCPHLTKENKDQLRKRDLLTAYYELDYLRNPKGSNYWRNRWEGVWICNQHSSGLISLVHSVSCFSQSIKGGVSVQGSRPALLCG